MALVAMAVFDNEENKRTKLTCRTLHSLHDTVDFNKHRLIISDNGSCLATQELYEDKLYFFPNAQVINNGSNIGTAKAINRAWELRKPGEVCVKMDNDVKIHKVGWLDLLEDGLRRDPSLGILGLKRNDLDERPGHEHPFYRSTLEMLPHAPGQPWLVVELVQHVMGTCQAYSPALLDKIGYLYQMQDEGNLYGFDDSIASFRARQAGFKTGFLMGVEIDHIDFGNSVYTDWKSQVAQRWMSRYNQVLEEYKSGRRPLYYEDQESG